MRITLVISSLGAGGAERIISVMANYWAEKGWQVTLLTLDDGSAPPFFDLHSAIVHSPLGVARNSSNLLEGILNNGHRVYVLRKAIKASAPQVVISLLDQTNVLTLLATAGLDVPILVNEQIDPHYYSIGTVWQLLRRLLYRRATYVIPQTERALNYFSPSVRRRCRVIPNPAILPAGGELDHGSSGDNRAKTVLAMGRLDHQKGFDMLLHAFAKVSPNHPLWTLEIWGEGPLRPSLESLCRQLGLDGQVRLPGKTKQPLEKMRQADLFVLSSRFEGFPTVLCEAMACGLPVISFNCPSGPDEIIRNQVDGVLVPAEDVDALASTMDRLMRDESERQRLARQAPEVLARFGLQRVMGMWEELIQEAVQ